MMNAVTVLYIAILISTHHSTSETLTSLFVLLLHDFTQHVIVSSHKCHSLVFDALKNRMFLSATVGVQLVLLNLCVAQLIFFSPLVHIVQQTSAEWPGHGIQLDRPAPLVLRSLRKIYQHGSLQSTEIFIGFLSVIPASLVQTGAHWFSAVTYGNMSVRRAFHGSRVARLCLDDVMVNGLVSAVALLTGQRMVRMVEALVSTKLFGGAVDIYRGELIPQDNSRGAIVGVLLSVLMSVFDVLSSVSCQGLMCTGVAKRDVFGKQSETKRAFLKVWMFQEVLGALRIGMLVDWENWFANIACMIAAGGVLTVVARYAWDEYGRLKIVEERRERALRG